MRAGNRRNTRGEGTDGEERAGRERDKGGGLILRNVMILSWYDATAVAGAAAAFRFLASRA